MSARPTRQLNRREALRLLGAGTALLMYNGRPMEAASNAITRPIPRSGERLPVIGLGTWQTFDVGSSPVDRAPLEDVLKTFVALGGKVIDSSPMYGTSESVAGDLAAKLALREKLFVATKVWTSGRKTGVQQMKESMRRLRVRQLDLMQVHNLVDADAHLDTLAGWKRDGLVRYIGVTHWHAGALGDVTRFMRRYELDFVQINYSIREREAEKELLPLAVDRKIAVIANRPFASGEIFNRTRGKALPAWAKEIDCDSWAQLFLKFIISHPAITCAIPATSKLTHLRDNMKAGLGRLPDARLRERIAGAV